MQIRSAPRGLIGMGEGNDALILPHFTSDRWRSSGPHAVVHLDAAATRGFAALVGKTGAGAPTA